MSLRSRIIHCTVHCHSAVHVPLAGV